jgi:Tfp pilus assembly protein PilX
MIKNNSKTTERGIALFFAVFALLLLMAIAAALTFVASIETSVNSNYRQEQVAYFAAKAGLEEARARMMQSDPNTINTTGTPLPINPPTTTNGSVIYIVNPGSSANSVQPWSSTNKYADDELCHDGYSGATGSLFTTAQIVAPGVRCTSNGTSSGTPLLPTGTAWYTSYNSQLPFNGTSAALSYKWVRISPKLNSSVSYLDVTGVTSTINNYTVNSSRTAGTLICWNGTQELPLNAADTSCSQMLTTAGSPMTSVYEIASLGVSPMGARKMVQAEVALTPVPPFIYGMYGTSTACPAISFTGNNPSTNSFTSANGGTYATTVTSTGGDIGANGGVSVGNGNIGGIVGVTNTACATPVSLGSQGTMLGTVACPSGNSAACFLPAPYTFPVPPAPSPTPPTTNTSPSTCTTTTTTGHGHNTTTTTTSYDCLVPGTYGNISIQASLTLAPGTYNINSLSMTGNAGIIVNPPGSVTLNVAGTGQTTAVAIAGNGIIDDNVANDFIINYGGTNGVSIAGNGNVTAILNAPNAPITQQGNGNWYGSIVGSTISIGGNAFFHYDRNSNLAPANNGYYTMVSYREVPY